MLSRPDLIFGIALPIVISLIAVLLHRRIGGAIAAPISLAVAIVGIEGWPTPFPPNDSLKWILFIALALILVGLRDSLVNLPILLRTLTAAIVSFFCVYLITGNFRTGLESGEAKWLAGFSAAVFILCVSSQLVLGRCSPRNSSLLLMLLAGASAVVIGLTNSQGMGNREGTLALAMLPALIFAGIGCAVVFIPLWATILIAHGVYNFDVPTLPMLLIAISPLCWWLGQLPRSEKWRKILRPTAALIPQLIAIILVAIEFSHHIDEL